MTKKSGEKKVPSKKIPAVATVTSVKASPKKKLVKKTESPRPTKPVKKVTKSVAKK